MFPVLSPRSVLVRHRPASCHPRFWETGYNSCHSHVTVLLSFFFFFFPYVDFEWRHPTVRFLKAVHGVAQLIERLPSKQETWVWFPALHLTRHGIGGVCEIPKTQDWKQEGQKFKVSLAAGEFKACMG